MNQHEVRQLVERIRVSIQKTRSNIIEAMAGSGEPDSIDMEALELLNPSLFGESGINILDLTNRILAKPEIEPIDIFNLLNLIDRHEPVVAVTFSLLYTGKELPSGISAMAAMMNQKQEA